MKKYIFSKIIFTLTFFLMAHSHAFGSTQSMAKNHSHSSITPGEIAAPTVEGDLIKVNNKLCAVSRTPIDEKTLGTFKGKVAYEGKNPKYKGKTFEFNYCCSMCMNSFPKQFKKDPDGILSFHGL